MRHYDIREVDIKRDWESISSNIPPNILNSLPNIFTLLENWY